MDEPTAEAIRRAQEGDNLALERIVRTVYPLMYRWALLRTADPDDADDVAQSALVLVHRHLPEFGFGSRFTTWLYTIVRRVALDWRRAHGRRVAREQHYARDVLHGATPAETERVDLERRLALLREALASLTPRQREVFDMIELQGMDASEVAQIMGLSASTARVHLLRARRAVRSWMLEHDG